MFSFITKYFKKNKKETQEEIVEPKEYQWGDQVPYSCNFTGVEEVRVSATDCTRANVVSVDRVLYEPIELEQIIELLEKLAAKGTRELVVNPCTQHTVTAYADKKPFAQVKLYDGQLQLENGLTVGKNERLLKQQAALFALVKVDLPG